MHEQLETERPFLVGYTNESIVTRKLFYNLLPHKKFKPTPSTKKVVTALYSAGCGSQVVNVSDNGMQVMSSSPVPLKTHRVGRSELKRHLVGVVWQLAEGVLSQVSSPSLDHGSNLRGPSPKALV
ncbi:hypothetical protein TNCV_361331 [Trichonephila clavipes]|nr:hypothetical protein TNCV_361331 [Trichonephila clavipes]